jgi:putative glutamine amidotransferase
MNASSPLIGITAHQSLVTESVGVPVAHHVTSVAYVRAIRKAGGTPVLLPMGDPRDAEGIVDRVDGVLVTGGDDVNPDRYDAPVESETKAADPARDDFEIALINAAIAHDRPLLCVCRGIQVLNVARGGTLHQHHEGHFDFDRYNDGAHEVEIDAGSMLAKIVGGARIEVNSVHHQTVATLGADVHEVARTDDGVVEAVEVDHCAFALAVQWHPELLRHRDEHLALFEALVSAARGPR